MMARVQADALSVTAFAQPARRLRASVTSFLAGIEHAWQRHTGMRQLSEMSDWQLADIGLTRCDVDVVALRIPRAHMTRELQKIAHERTLLAAMRSSTRQDH